LQISRDGSLQLTYCTNIHAADGWPAVNAALRHFAPALKARFSPDAPFGVGLRLSARDARELLDGHLPDLQTFLRDQGLYVAIINGFPHGSFHRSVVKAQVYAPDWRDAERVRYTLDLIDILAALLPDGFDGGVSTVPLSYKPWMHAAPGAEWQRILRHLVEVAARLVRLRQERGAWIHLDIEPEPDCLLENTAETVRFFHDRLIHDGAPLLASALGVGVGPARDSLLDHIQVCFDCCHFSVAHEPPAEAIRAILDAGIRIGRIQLSSALHVTMPAATDAADAAMARLRPFADSTYLHQVVRREGGALQHFADLPDALAHPAPGDWRIHFHVPLFTGEYDGLRSTQDDVRQVLDLVTATCVTRHLEIETYTWDVLPARLKIDLLESIAREYTWVLDAIRQPNAARS
jgi:sugar phosphate isomerase/epimerase